MKYEIKHKFTGEVLFLLECGSLRLCIEAAVKEHANLRYADLQGTDLRGADLQGANLRGADLQGADLRGANLQGANLLDANLQGANLQGADLQGTDLRGADLQGANLRGANLQGANLQGADLQGANLWVAYLHGADLHGVKNAELAIAHTRILPDGQLIGWKKCGNGVIAKLSIPAEAKRSHAFGRKCRAEFSDVLELFNGDVGVTSAHGPRTEYRVGQRVHCDKWDDNFQNECSGGIHFFITREEAEDWT